MNNTKGKLVVLSGPSGVGKGVISQNLACNEDFVMSVSATTRKPRILCDGRREEDGVEYLFRSKAWFEEAIRSGDLLEYDFHFDHYYGTPKSYVYENMEKGKNVILEIDVLGGAQVAKIIPDTILIFVLPPSMKELRRRLKARGTEDDAAIEKRIQRVKEELDKIQQYDYAIINHNIEECANAVCKMVRHGKTGTAELEPYTIEKMNPFISKLKGEM